MENMVNDLAAKRQNHIDNIDNLTLNKIKAIVRTLKKILWIQEKIFAISGTWSNLNLIL